MTSANSTSDWPLCLGSASAGRLDALAGASLGSDSMVATKAQWIRFIGYPPAETTCLLSLRGHRSTYLACPCSRGPRIQWRPQVEREARPHSGEDQWQRTRRKTRLWHIPFGYATHTSASL